MSTEIHDIQYETIQGRDVPALGFGTWQLSGQACIDGVRDALEIGYRHLDTAQMYKNEREVGRGIADSGVDRGEIFLTSKLWHDALKPGDVRRTTEESLARLDTDYLDLMLIHWPNESVPLPQTLGAMMDLREQGKLRHIGVSNFTPSLFDAACDLAPIFANQVEYHPYLSQRTLIDKARRADAMLTAYSPLARGRVLDDPTLKQIGEQHGKNPAQVVIRWMLQQDHVTVIPKAADAEHRRANFDVFDFELTDHQMQQIHELNEGERIIDPGFAPDWER